MMKQLLLLLYPLCSVCFLNAQDIYNITQYQAKGDGKTINTTCIQRAIDDCATRGGGTVWIPAGTYMTGCIYLKSNVNLHLSNGAVLKANPDINDYDKEYMTLVYIKDAVNVSITGKGTIDGNGKNFSLVEEGKERPYVVFVHASKSVTIRDVSLLHAARWTLRLFASNQVLVNGITIYAHSNHNNDGIDIDSKNVVISDCIIDSDDDAICLKSENPGAVTENITVSNCVIASNCNMIKMGTGSQAGFKNISITNCVLKAAAESPFWKWHERIKGVADTLSGLAGIALEIVDGGVMDQVVISNISMTGIQTPIFIRLGKRSNSVGVLRNVVISNITARANSLIASVISAVPGSYIENIVLRDMILIHTGGGTHADLNRKVPEQETKYPENRMFGHSLPAYGLYVRHAKNITVENVQFQVVASDVRPAIWLDDVKAVFIKNATPAEVNASLIKMTNATEVFYNHLRL